MDATVPTEISSTFDHELASESLVKSYGGRRVVNGVSIGMNAGEVVGLLGPNGAGKTTTFYMMVGLVKPEEGRVLLRGNDLSKAPLHVRARQGIGYLPQEPSTFRKLTVEENLQLIWQMLGVSESEIEIRVTRLLQDFGLESLRHQNVVALSGGERRRLEISRAMATEPRYLLLDEPFTGVDPLHVNEIQEIVRELQAKGIGILITDHNASALLEIVDRVYIISEGKILVHGTPSEVVDDPLARKHYLGERFYFRNESEGAPESARGGDDLPSEMEEAS